MGIKPCHGMGRVCNKHHNINTFLFDKKISFDSGGHDPFHILVLVPIKESSKKGALGTSKNQIFLCLSWKTSKHFLAVKATRQDLHISSAPQIFHSNQACSWFQLHAYRNCTTARLNSMFYISVYKYYYYNSIIIVLYKRI